MARLTIEQQWWTDPRRRALIKLLKDEDLADARVLKAWRLAQDFWGHGRSLIPKALFETLESCTEILAAGLAEIREEGVYVRGSSSYLDWLQEKREAGRVGGKKSGQVRRKKAEANAKQIEADRSKAKQIEPSSSSSSSSSSSKNKNEESIGDARAIAARESEASKGVSIGEKKAIEKREVAQKANHFVGAYIKAYQTRFPASRPEDLNDGKVRGQILNFAKEYPLGRACELVQVYFQMDTKWFGTKGYDFITFRNNLNKIGQALDSGVDPDGNTIDWSKVDLR
jgi:hypothetical protein